MIVQRNIKIKVPHLIGSVHNAFGESLPSLNEVGSSMEARDFDLMSTDELWSLHQELATRLAARLTSEKAMLESRLKQLNQQRTSERQAGLTVLKRERR